MKHKDLFAFLSWEKEHECRLGEGWDFLIYRSSFIPAVLVSAGVMFGTWMLHILPKTCDTQRNVKNVVMVLLGLILTNVNILQVVLLTFRLMFTLCDCHTDLCQVILFLESLPREPALLSPTVQPITRSPQHLASWMFCGPYTNFKTRFSST